MISIKQLIAIAYISAVVISIPQTIRPSHTAHTHMENHLL